MDMEFLLFVFRRSKFGEEVKATLANDTKYQLNKL